jgi:ABC-2 type transport system permease protein
MAALIRRTARDGALLLGVIALSLVLMEIVFAFFISQLSTEFLEQLPEVIRRLIQGLAGIDVTQAPQALFVTVGFIHPLVLAITWAFLIALGTRATVGQIDRGTADLLLALPVRRATVYVATSLVWAAGTVILAASVCIGAQLGPRIAPLEEHPDAATLLIPAVNLVALLLATGAMIAAVSAFCTRRGVAVGVAVAVLLAAFLLHFLEPFLSFFRKLGVIGFLHYYRPVETVRDGVWPLRDIAVLLVAGAFVWLIGLWRFTRRDIPAV